MRTSGILLSALFAFLCMPILHLASAGEDLFPHSSELPPKSQQELNALRKEYKGKYRKIFFSANKLVKKEELLARVKRGWELFNFFCRYCHGYSERAGGRAEMLLNPPLNDAGRLSKTRAGFLKMIYFGGKNMPPFGMGAFNGKIVASPEGYVARHGSRRLMPEEALDIAFYLHFCYQSPKPVRWKEMDGKVQLDLSDFE